MDVIVLGRKIGTVSGWDESDFQVLCFYDFKSLVEDIPNAPLIFINFTEGEWAISNEDESKVSGDLMPILATLPRKE